MCQLLCSLIVESEFIIFIYFAGKRRKLSRKFIIRALAAVMLYIAAASYIFRHEASYFYENESFEGNYSFSQGFNELTIPVNKEVNLHALVFSASQPKGVVLLFPSGEYLSQEFDPTKNFFYQNGYNLLIPEYRGNGKSTGNYHAESEFINDSKQWFLLAVRMADTLPLIVYGQEFGAVIAAQLSSTENVKYTMLENPPYSWNEIMLKKYFWWLPHSYFSQFKFPVWKYLKQTQSKLVLIHSTQAEFIPVENSLRLLEFLKPGDEYIELDSKITNQLSPEYQKKMGDFLKTNKLYYVEE